LKVAALALFTLDGFKQRLEISLAETAATLALNDLEEEGGPILHWPCEDLQHVALIIPVDKNAELFQLIDGLINDSNPLLQLRVIRMRDVQEIDPLRVKIFHRVQDVVRG